MKVLSMPVHSRRSMMTAELGAAGTCSLTNDLRVGPLMCEPLPSTRIHKRPSTHPARIPDDAFMKARGWDRWM